MRLSDIDLVDRHGETLPAQRLLLAVFCPVITHLVLAKPEGIDDDVSSNMYKNTRFLALFERNCQLIKHLLFVNIVLFM